MGSRFTFDVPKEQSAVKTAIITKYFTAWCNIMKSRLKKIGYIDLFAGPGIYEDGTKSTPIIVLEKIISDKLLSEKVVTLFNEKDENRYSELKRNVSSLDGIERLSHKPIIINKEVNHSTAEYFKKTNLIPCFSFIDPAGYCGLTLDLIISLSKDYGSDLIFFFNYNDINRGLTNEKVISHMELLFGKETYQVLKNKVNSTSEASVRELIIINELAQSIKDNGINYVLPFRFQFEGKNRTSHYLIFASKKFLGYKIMKEIMYGEGEKDSEGVGKFEFIPSSDRMYTQLSFIDMFNSSLKELKLHLTRTYKGRKVNLLSLYKEDSIGNRYLIKHYKQVLLELEEEGKIICNPPRELRRKYKGKPTLNEKTVKIKFI